MSALFRRKKIQLNSNTILPNQQNQTPIVDTTLANPEPAQPAVNNLPEQADPGPVPPNPVQTAFDKPTVDLTEHQAVPVQPDPQTAPVIAQGIETIGQSTNEHIDLPASTTIDSAAAAPTEALAPVSGIPSEPSEQVFSTSIPVTGANITEDRGDSSSVNHFTTNNISGAEGAEPAFHGAQTAETERFSAPAPILDHPAANGPADTSQFGKSTEEPGVNPAFTQH
jgi:hypothetical protein